MRARLGKPKRYYSARLRSGLELNDARRELSAAVDEPQAIGLKDALNLATGMD
jgi:hypothetical protein